MNSLGWSGIVRLGLVQTALGAIVVLATSTMNRVMVVELALPAVIPGALVALHYAVQVLRPRLGYGSDVGGHRTPWIVGGMFVLALGDIVAALATWLMGSHPVAGIALAVVGFILIGIGVGASGTSLLVLLAKRVGPERRAAAATVIWIMMIAGFVVTTVVAGHLMDPFTPARLVAITCGVAATAVVVTLLATWGIEGRIETATPLSAAHAGQPFRAALAQVWQEPPARRLALFVFVSMLAYSAEELILDPFAGAVFGYTPGQSTKLSGVLHGGVLAGMVIVALAGSHAVTRRLASLRSWMIGGCIASAAGLALLTAAGIAGAGWPLRESVFALGVANGTFAVAAIGSMMSLAGSGRESREGVRMGLWGAAQGVAFCLGGLLASAGSDVARHLLGSPGVAYAVVFGCEAVLFVAAAMLAVRLESVAAARPAAEHETFTGGYAAGG